MNPSSIPDQSTKGKKNRIPVDADIDSGTVTAIRTNNNTQATEAHTASSYPIYMKLKKTQSQNKSLKIEDKKFMNI